MATRVRLAAAILGLALAACASVSTPTGAPSGTDAGPALALGDVGDDPQRLAQRFGPSVERRYPIGMSTTDAVKDLQSQGFVCARPKAAAGDPPLQTCRRRLDANNCKHTWQVFLYKDRSARGLYDRACAGDELLGGRR